MSLSPGLAWEAAGQAGMLSNGKNVMKQENAVREELRAAPTADPGLAGCAGGLGGCAEGLFLLWDAPGEFLGAAGATSSAVLAPAMARAVCCQLGCPCALGL